MTAVVVCWTESTGGAQMRVLGKRIGMAGGRPMRGVRGLCQLLAGLMLLGTLPAWGVEMQVFQATDPAGPHMIDAVDPRIRALDLGEPAERVIPAAGGRMLLAHLPPGPAPGGDRRGTGARGA